MVKTQEELNVIKAEIETVGEKIKELTEEELIRQPIPALDELFDRFTSLTTAEVAEIYSINEQSAERELKKRMLQQKVERIMTDDITMWRVKIK